MTLDPEFEKTYRAAQECFDGHRIDEAERLFQTLLERNPRGYADVFNRLGLIYSTKGLLERAAQYFEKALALNPTYTEASLNLAVTFNELGRFDDAEKVFTRAAGSVQGEPASLDPFIKGKIANEHAKLGDSYYGLGMLEDALAEYRKAMVLRPQFADVMTKIGSALREKGDVAGAVDAFTRAKTLNPNYLPAYILLGVTYFSQGDRTRAAQEWKAAQRIAPSNRAVQVYLAMAGE